MVSPTPRSTHTLDDHFGRTARDLRVSFAGTHPRVAHGVPTLWIQLMVHYLHNPPERMSLQEIFVGGSPVPPALIKVWEERYGVDVVHVWGMTETSTVGTVARPPSGTSSEARYEGPAQAPRPGRVRHHRLARPAQPAEGDVVKQTAVMRGCG